jgi:hypothetical protein
MMRDIILFKLIEELENCECVDGCICFKTTDINTEKNNEIIEKHYPLLRKLYKLSAPTRKPKKFTSQTILQISKFQKYDIYRKTKYRRNKELKKDTTFGLYNISIDNDPLT